MPEIHTTISNDDDFDIPIDVVDQLLHDAVFVAKLAEQDDNTSINTRRAQIGGIIDSFVKKIL